VIYNPNYTMARKYDPVKAKQLLAEAGYSGGFKTTIITMSSLDKNQILAIQSYLAAVNIIADVQYLGMATFTQDIWFGTWHNAVLYMTIPSFPNYNFVLNWWFAGGKMFKSWLQTPEYLQAYQASSNSPYPDSNLMRAVTDTWAKQASVIPIVEGGSGMTWPSYVMGTHVGERRVPAFSPETTWLNK
jgi:ABC-type transport system substrate-binding protein